MKKQLLLSCLYVGAFYALYLFCHRQTDGFQVIKILSSLPSYEEWEVPLSSSTETKTYLDTLTKQPFYYLDKGGQSYAFLSQDGTVVLKLFKMHNLRQYLWSYQTPLPGLLDHMRIRLLCQQKHKLHRLFNSCHLAYTQLKEETGLLYLSLNPNPDLNMHHILLVDKLGITHRLSLDHIPFALQRRADRALDRVKKNLKEQNLAAAKSTLEQMVSCLKERHAKGIIDGDPALRRNMGLLENRAIFLDIGAFFSTNAPLSQEYLIEETTQLRHSLEKRSPELALYLDSLLTQPIQIEDGLRVD